MAGPTDPRAVATLGRLVLQAASGVLELVAAPSGLDVEVSAARVVGLGDEGGIRPGDLVLGVTGTAEGCADHMIAAAGAAGATGVVVRSDDDLSARTQEVAWEAGVALLRVPRDVGWDQIFGLIEAVVHSSPLAGPGDVPSVPLGDLVALADSVAAVVGGAVTIEDLSSRVLAYSVAGTDLEDLDEPRRQSILQRRTPDEWLRRFAEVGVFEKFMAGESVVRIVEFADLGLRPRLVAPIRAGAELLGSIWVVPEASVSAARSEAALLEAARIAAAHLLSQRAAEDAERRLRSDLLRSLFDGRAATAGVAERLGLDAAVPAAVIGFEARVGSLADAPLVRERVLGLVWFAAEARRAATACAALGDICYALVPLAHGGDPADVHQLAAGVVARAKGALGVDLRAGIGSALPGAAGAARSRIEADEILAVLRRSAPVAQVASIEDVLGHAVVAEARQLLELRPQLRSSQLATLNAYDDQHDTDYVDSLRAYLSCFGDVAAAAQRVRVHPNTFRYRMRRLSQLAGIDLDDPDQRLAIALELSATIAPTP